MQINPRNKNNHATQEHQRATFSEEKGAVERELWQTNTPAKGRKKQAKFVIQRIKVG